MFCRLSKVSAKGYNDIMRSLKSSSFRGSFISSLTETLQENESNQFNFTFKICKEYFVTVSVVMYFRKNSYLIETVNHVLIRLEAAGLIEYWDSKFIDKKALKVIQVDNEPKALTFSQLIGSLQLWVCGCFIAISCFLIELFYHFLLRRIVNSFYYF